MTKGWIFLCLTCLAAPVVAGAQLGTNGEQVLYSTGFEPSEGYLPADSQAELRGQMGWIGAGSGGNGLVTNYFVGSGQQAYIGYNPPAYKDLFLNLWHPLSPPVTSTNVAVLRFSVAMQIVDSTNGEYDDFRWSAYNAEGHRFFSLDFDNSRAEIFYVLDDQTGFHDTGFAFVNNVTYDLEILMNLQRNDWLAVLNGQVVVDAQPMTTAHASLDFSDMDAVWAIRKQGSPGDNYMLFDNYQITVEPGATIPPSLEVVGRRPDGQFELILHGERDLPYAVDVSTNLTTWSSLGSTTLTNGYWDLLDTSAADYPLSFYRARQLKP